MGLGAAGFPKATYLKWVLTQTLPGVSRDAAERLHQQAPHEWWPNQAKNLIASSRSCEGRTSCFEKEESKPLWMCGRSPRVTKMSMKDGL